MRGVAVRIGRALHDQKRYGMGARKPGGKADLLANDVFAGTVLRESAGRQQLNQSRLRGKHLISSNGNIGDDGLGIDLSDPARKKPIHLVAGATRARLNDDVAGIADDVERALALLDHERLLALIPPHFDLS